MQRSETVVDGWTIATVRTSGKPTTRIYIEGDGRAYISRDTVSGNPTPVNPIGLKLALADRTDGVVYLARPCQWTRGPECKDSSMWTERRFTDQVARVYTEIVQKESDGRPVELVGYSGGAWVAIQVAARLPNVTKVTTVAGNLMPNWVNAQHHVTKMNVAPYPAFKREMPVVAYVGVDDLVVPPGVVPVFMAETGLQVDVIEMKATHNTGWVAE